MANADAIRQRWEWEGDSGKWTAYSKEHNDELTDAANTGKKLVTLNVGSGAVKLEIQFGKMIQKNKSTGWERRVRLCVTSDSANDDYYSWEWEDENQVWNPYLHDAALKLERGRAAHLASNDVKTGNVNGSAVTNSNGSNVTGAKNKKKNSDNESNIISFKSAGRNYEVDVQSLTQRNVTTDVTRTVRRILSTTTSSDLSTASSSSVTSAAATAATAAGKAKSAATTSTGKAAVSAAATAAVAATGKAAAAAGTAQTQRGRNKMALAACMVSDSESEGEDSKPKSRLTRSTSKRGAESSSSSSVSAAAVEEPSVKKIKKSNAAVSKSQLSAAAKSAPQSTVKTVVVKGRAPVDPECSAKVNSAHVYCEGGDVYDTMLNQTNIGNNNNKFYLIQLLEDDGRKNYSVWFRWGRVGARGQSSLEQHGPSLDSAKDSFCKKFTDKTKNEWSSRKKFQKVAGKYDMVKLDYSAKTDPTNKKPDSVTTDAAKIPESKLDEKLQALIKLICDVKEMEDVVMEMKYDANKAPLGRLTTDQIKAGYAALKKIDALISKHDYGSKLTEACNEFYTRIPHDFKMSRPPVIRTEADVKAKLQLLEALGDIEIAMRLLQETKSTENPVDSHYKSLKCNMSVMDHSDPMFKLICDYVKNTHAPTHNQYKIKVLDVFCVERDEEVKRFRDLGSRMLLWHGTRLTNMVGILSRGLRVAPPEAPATGYMFGKGIYFADMCSKSANYCFPTRSKTTGIVLLCEVSLGNTNELMNADYNADKLPAGKHSVKGLGKQGPDPAKNHICADGSVMPLGLYKDTGVVNPTGYTLNYNEFIVYDSSQVKMRYAVQVQFNFN